MIKFTVQFISLEDYDKDIIISFALHDSVMGIKSLILHRTLFYENLLDDEERGVKVWLEGDSFDEEDFNMLHEIKVADQEIRIRSSFRSYQLDASEIDKKEIGEMVALLKKQNYDHRFKIDIA
jgi:hypothetical protein